MAPLRNDFWYQNETSLTILASAFASICFVSLVIVCACCKSQAGRHKSAAHSIQSGEETSRGRSEKKKEKKKVKKMTKKKKGSKSQSTTSDEKQRKTRTGSKEKKKKKSVSDESRLKLAEEMLKMRTQTPAPKIIDTIVVTERAQEKNAPHYYEPEGHRQSPTTASVGRGVPQATIPAVVSGRELNYRTLYNVQDDFQASKVTKGQRYFLSGPPDPVRVYTVQKPSKPSKTRTDDRKKMKQRKEKYRKDRKIPRNIVVAPKKELPPRSVLVRSVLVT